MNELEQIISERLKLLHGFLNEPSLTKTGHNDASRSSLRKIWITRLYNFAYFERSGVEGKVVS